MTEKRKPLFQSLAAAIVGMFEARGLPTRNTVTRGIAKAPKDAFVNRPMFARKIPKVKIVIQDHGISYSRSTQRKVRKNARRRHAAGVKNAFA